MLIRAPVTIHEYLQQYWQ